VRRHVAVSRQRNTAIPPLAGLIINGDTSRAVWEGGCLLAAAQAVEHYEISRYGTLIAWAEELSLDDAVTLLEETLEEEKATDQALTEIAKTAINQQAEAA
jgi:ferritin-like metal-binding protein YciE